MRPLGIALRPTPYQILREQCFVVEEDDFDIPEGRVRIERSDSIDVEGIDLLADDEEAALRVCELAEAPGVAMNYAPSARLWEPVPMDGLGTVSVRWAELETAACAIEPEHANACPKWVILIPVFVAKAVGLMT